MGRIVSDSRQVFGFYLYGFLLGSSGWGLRSCGLGTSIASQGKGIQYKSIFCDNCTYSVRLLFKVKGVCRTVGVWVLRARFSCLAVLVNGRCSSSGVELLLYHTSWQVSMLEEETLYCVLRFGPHYFIMSKCKAVKHVKTYLSPVDVESFVRVCLGLGQCLHPC